MNSFPSCTWEGRFIFQAVLWFFLNKELKHSFYESYIPKYNLGMSDKEFTFIYE